MVTAGGRRTQRCSMPALLLPCRRHACTVSSLLSLHKYDDDGREVNVGRESRSTRTCMPHRWNDGDSLAAKLVLRSTMRKASARQHRVYSQDLQLMCGLITNVIHKFFLTIINMTRR